MSNLNSNRANQFLKREIISIIALACVFSGIYVFHNIASGVRSGQSHEWDKQVLLSLRSPSDPSDPVGPSWVEELARDTTALGGIPLLTLLGVGVCGTLLLQGKYETALLVIVAIIGALLLSSALKYGYDRPRPELVPHHARVFTRSFPSGHSTMAAATYLTLGVLLSRASGRRSNKLFIMTLATLLTVAVGVSRVYLGVHWPTDVLAGWAIGSVWALICWLISRWQRKDRRAEVANLSQATSS